MRRRNVHRAVGLALVGGAAAWFGARAIGPAHADPQKVGINVLLTGPATDDVLAALAQHGTVLDVIPQINAVTLRADESELAAVEALPCVAVADVDAELDDAGADGLPVPDLSGGSTLWNLDAINVTDHGGGRTIAYDGTGVYVAIVDTGLPYNWRTYFPEERIDSVHARAFTGGGGEAHVISSQPDKWEHDTDGHGTTLTSVVLGFAYSGSDDALPRYFNGVAPKATVIPVKYGGPGSVSSGRFESLISHAVVYAADLKSGELGGAPLVINLSSGVHRPLPMERAAIDYAIAQGAIVVAAAGNEANQGMRFPAAYPEVISVAAVGPVSEFPADDPTQDRWILRDVPENDASQFFVAPFSSRALAGQELDVAAPGFPVPTAYTRNGAQYSFAGGTSQATPHVAGIAALMLQKHPGLTQGQVESILKSTAMPLPPGTATITWPNLGPGAVHDIQTWDRHDGVLLSELTTSWGADATGAGLVQADAALAATP
jgi:subtilisin family serine protease